MELAIVALFLFLLAAGTFDYGMAWRSGIEANAGVRTAARTGSSEQSERGADYDALSGMKASLASSGLLDDVQRVVVFRADSADGKVPPTCKTSSTSACQVITGANFRTNWEADPMTTATTSSGCLQIATSKNWCPTGRDAVAATAQYYGVWVQVRHDYMFPIIGDDVIIERTAVMRLEPEEDT
ncbi:MAG: pilus assembly protein [Acidimicrobiales bacterium]|nr:pilus assembly protein [Acidimicrobiales bacterium]